MHLRVSPQAEKDLVGHCKQNLVKVITKVRNMELLTLVAQLFFNNNICCELKDFQLEPTITDNVVKISRSCQDRAFREGITHSTAMVAII